MNKLGFSTLVLVAALPLLSHAQTAPATAPASEATPASLQSAQEIADYIESHADLSDKMKQAGLKPPLRAEDMDKLRPLLPADLAAKLDVAKPAFAQAAARAQGMALATNLKRVGLMIAMFAAASNDMQPATLLDLLPAPVEDLTAFVRPGVSIPDEVAKGDAAKQAAWVKANTPYAFPRLGQPLVAGPNPESTIIGAEDPALAPQKARLAALFADLHVELVERKAVEDALKAAATPKASR